MISYDTRGFTWEQWAALMSELFAARNLGSPPPEKEWRNWANGLCSFSDFSKSGIPSADAFATWQDWGNALTGILSVQND